MSFAKDQEYPFEEDLYLQQDGSLLNGGMPLTQSFPVEEIQADYFEEDCVDESGDFDEVEHSPLDEIEVYSRRRNKDLKLAESIHTVLQSFCNEETQTSYDWDYILGIATQREIKHRQHKQYVNNALPLIHALAKSEGYELVVIAATPGPSGNIWQKTKLMYRQANSNQEAPPGQNGDVLPAFLKDYRIINGKFVFIGEPTKLKRNPYRTSHFTEKDAGTDSHAILDLSVEAYDVRLEISRTIPKAGAALAAFTIDAMEAARLGFPEKLSALVQFKILPSIEGIVASCDFSQTDSDIVMKNIAILATQSIPTYYSSHGKKAYVDLHRWFENTMLSEFYEGFGTKVYAYIYRRTSDIVKSEELTSEVFRKMLESYYSGKYWKSSFSGWLYRIAHNIVIDAYRARDRRKDVYIEDIPTLLDRQNDPARLAELSMRKEHLQKALGGLTDDQSFVLQKRYIEGYSFIQIAEMLGRTEGAIKALKHRAIETLKVLLPYDSIN